MTEPVPSIDEAELRAGDIVETVKGAQFWGVLISIERDDPSKPGGTVKAIAPGFTGTKHVYPLAQLRRRVLDNPRDEALREAAKVAADYQFSDLAVQHTNQAVVANVSLNIRDAILSLVGTSGGGWQPIETAPIEQQVIVWEPMYGWLLALKMERYGWRIKSSGNFYGEMPASVVADLKFWRPLPEPPTPTNQDTENGK